MVRRSGASLVDVARLDNLAAAFHRAARGKRYRADVQAFEQHLERELSRLGAELLAGTVEVGRFASFRIFDPKPRTIHAPCFRERVLHHALMAVIGPPLDRALVADTFACRTGKGSLAALERADAHARRFPWFVKTDVRRYFDSIRHDVLMRRLTRRLKDPGVLAIAARIIAAYHTAPGTGLPIGALTSQHFANLFLDPLDRLLLEELRVGGLVRYMDDALWWCRTREEAHATLERAGALLAELHLELSPKTYVGRSARGVSFLGFRVFPGRRLLSRRRRVRYRVARAAWERAYLLGDVDALGLQAGYAAAHAIVAHGESALFRARDLARRPPVDA